MLKIKMIILEWQVLSNQSIYLQRGKMRFIKKEAKELKAKWVEEVKKQWKWEPVDYELWIGITYYHWDRRIRDIDNYWKIVLDCMTGIVYKDDSQIQYMYLGKKYDKENPRVEIIVKQSRDSGI